MHPKDKKYAADSTDSTDPAGSGHSTHFTHSTHSALNTLSTVIFYLAILFFIIGFNFRDVMVGNWFQQFMPNIGTQQINDITFLDSLTGFAVASRNVNPDTASILKTTNGGNNWQIVLTQTPRRFSRVKFINSFTGFISGGSGSGTPYLYKSTDGGNSWNMVTGATLGTAFWNDVTVLSEDTIFLVDNNSINGGVFLSVNGGANWAQQLSLGANNPDRIYMYNARIGFVGKSTGTAGFHKTTNGGQNWNFLSNSEGFNDMYFVDSLTGWKSPPMKKTTNGGLNWIAQIIPSGGNLIPGGNTFSNVNRDTIWMGGGYIFYPGNGNRGIINFTTNGGENWFYQMPDTSFGPSRFNFVNFVNKLNGWGYSTNFGVHTTTGGDGTFLTPVQQITTQVANEYKLFNNYPNPFNAMTKLKFQMSKQGYAVIKLYDVTGKEVSSIVNEKLNTGEYEIIFNAGNLSSGVYFYSLIIEGKAIDTKKMMLLK